MFGILSPSGVAYVCPGRSLNFTWSEQLYDFLNWSVTIYDGSGREYNGSRPLTVTLGDQDIRRFNLTSQSEEDSSGLVTLTNSNL